MSDPNDDTIKTYKENFSKYAEKTTVVPSLEFKDWIDTFISMLPPKGLVFEFGSATGRDARYFREKGIIMTCTDVVPSVLESLAKDNFETHTYDFRNEPNTAWLSKYDGVFANAVLLHATPESFKNALKNISKILKKNGVLAFSVKTGTGDEITHVKMDAPRYFKYYTEEELSKIVSDIGFVILDLRTADEGKWLQLIARNI